MSYLGHDMLEIAKLMRMSQKEISQKQKIENLCNKLEREGMEDIANDLREIFAEELEEGKDS